MAAWLHGCRLSRSSISATSPILAHPWHWPLIVFFVTWAERSPALWDGLLIIVVTLVLSHVTKVFVEDRFRNGSQPDGILISPLRIGVVSVGACLIASAAIWLAAGPAFGAGGGRDGERSRGELIENAPIHGDVMVPSLASVKKDKREFYAAGCFTSEKRSRRPGANLARPEGAFA